MSVSTGIIELFLRPPIGFMSLGLIPGSPFTGAGDFDRPRTVVPIGNVGTDAFGIRFVIHDAPPGYGMTENHARASFDRVVLTLSVVHRLIDGTEVETQFSEFTDAIGNLFFSESYPLKVRWALAPGVSANFWWYLRPLAP